MMPEEDPCTGRSRKKGQGHFFHFLPFRIFTVISVVVIFSFTLAMKIYTIYRNQKQSTLKYPVNVIHKTLIFNQYFVFKM